MHPVFLWTCGRGLLGLLVRSQQTWIRNKVPNYTGYQVVVGYTLHHALWILPTLNHPFSLAPCLVHLAVLNYVFQMKTMLHAGPGQDHAEQQDECGNGRLARLNRFDAGCVGPALAPGVVDGSRFSEKSASESVSVLSLSLYVPPPLPTH